MHFVTPETIADTDFLAGAMLLIDKPATWTSFDVVNKVRAALRHTLGVKKIKVGHSGTLDPAATGLLMICTGAWTKKLHELQGFNKEYTGTIRLGETTPTYDAEAEVEQRRPVAHITQDQLTSVASTFVGNIQQVPPAYSAVKIEGKRAYHLARKGKEVQLEPRAVEIFAFDIENIYLPDVDFRVHCSKGTYIRSLAHDLGQVLGCGAHLKRLVRTRIGEYHFENAWQLDVLIDAIHQSREPV